MACSSYTPVSIGLATGYRSVCAFPGTDYFLAVRNPVGLLGAEFSLFRGDGKGSAVLLDTDSGPPFWDYAPPTTDFDFEHAHTPSLSGRGHRGLFPVGDSAVVWATSRDGVFGVVTRSGDTINASGVRNAWGFELFSGSGPIPYVGDFTNTAQEGSRSHIGLIGAGTGRLSLDSHVILIGENDFTLDKGTFVAVYTAALTPVSSSMIQLTNPPGWPVPYNRWYGLAVPGGPNQTIFVVEDNQGDGAVWACVVTWNLGAGTVASQSAWQDITPPELPFGWYNSGSFLYEVDSYSGPTTTKLVMSIETWIGDYATSSFASYTVSGGAFTQVGFHEQALDDYRAGNALWSSDGSKVGLLSTNSSDVWRFECASPTLAVSCGLTLPAGSVAQGGTGLQVVDAHGSVAGTFEHLVHTTSLVGSFGCTTSVPPLRRRQRDDGARRAKTSSSKQASTRRGRGNTYW